MNSIFEDFFDNHITWSKCYLFINGWISRMALFIPIIGYLILFNDSVANLLVFNIIANTTELYLNINQKLRCLYFAFIFLGLSNLIYKVQRPNVLLYGLNSIDYTYRCLNIFTKSNYDSLLKTLEDHRIRNNSNSVLIFAANNVFKNTNKDPKYFEKKTWDKNDPECREFLQKYFEVMDKTKRSSIIVCCCLSAFGYLLLFVPSFDLFVRIIITVF